MENSKKRSSTSSSAGSSKSSARANPERAAALHDEAEARLRLVRQAAGNFAAQLPSVDDWATFVRREIVPVYNAVSQDDRMCVECGRRTARDARGSVCSPACADKLTARSPAKRGRGAGASSRDDSHETAKIQLGDLVAASRGVLHGDTRRTAVVEPRRPDAGEPRRSDRDPKRR